MTISNQTLKTYSRGYLSMVKRGYLVDARPASEEEWSEDAHLTYRQELTKIAKFYLRNPEFKPCQLLMKVYPALDEEAGKYCGAGTHMSAYDYDGKEFPCHMFTRIVQGDYPIDFYKSFDFGHPLAEAQGKCVKCVLRRYCPTCIGCNFQNRGALNKRDTRRCKMVLAEMKVVSAFQILYLTKLAESRVLTEEEMLILQRALPTYDLVKRLRYSDFSNQVIRSR